MCSAKVIATLAVTFYCLFGDRLLFVEGAIGNVNKPATRRTTPATQAPPMTSSTTMAVSTTTEADDKKAKTSNEALSQLLNSIFDNYHKELVPRRPTVIKMDLLLLKVKSTIEKEGIFESVIALFMTWNDDRLVWNPHDYGNVSMLAFESEKIWLPDIAMTNSADHLYAISKDTRFVVRVSSDGTMKFVPTGTSRTWCDLKLLQFPFDIQTCSFEFESWSLDSTTMTLDRESASVVDDSFASPQWALCSHSAYIYDHVYNFTGEIFTRVRYDFVIRRKSTFYIINLIFPCATLSIIQLLVFVIPSTDSTSDRVGFGTTNMLTLVVFQTIVTAEMPKSSDAVTALSKYIIALIITSAVGIFQSVIVERMLRATTEAPPRWAIHVMACCPLLWTPQMPSGINQMILEGGHSGPSKSEDTVKKGLANLMPPAIMPPAGHEDEDPVDKMPLEDKKRSSDSLGGDDCGDKKSTKVQRKASSLSSGSRRKNKDERPSKRQNSTRSLRSDGTEDAEEEGDKISSSKRSGGNRKKSASGGALSVEFEEATPNGMKTQASRSNDYTTLEMNNGFAERLIDERSATRYCPPQQPYEMSPCLELVRHGYQNGTIPGAINGCVVGDSPSDLGKATKKPKPILKKASDDRGRKAGNDDDSSTSDDELEDVDDELEVSETETYDVEDAEQEEIVRIHINNGIKWGELITKLDHLTFIFCLAVSVGSPIALFVPLFIEGMYDCNLKL